MKDHDEDFGNGQYHTTKPPLLFPNLSENLMRYFSIRGFISIYFAFLALIFLLGGIANVILFFILPEMTYFNLIMGLASFHLGLGLAYLSRYIWKGAENGDSKKKKCELVAFSFACVILILGTFLWIDNYLINNYMRDYDDYFRIIMLLPVLLLIVLVLGLLIINKISVFKELSNAKTLRWFTIHLVILYPFIFLEWLFLIFFSFGVAFIIIAYTGFWLRYVFKGNLYRKSTTMPVQYCDDGLYSYLALYGGLSWMPILATLALMMCFGFMNCSTVLFHPSEIAVIVIFITLSITPLFILMIKLRNQYHNPYRLLSIWLCSVSLQYIAVLGLIIDPRMEGFGGTISTVIYFTWPITLLILSICSKLAISTWKTNENSVEGRNHSSLSIIPAIVIFLVLPIISINYAYSVDWPDEPYYGYGPLIQIECIENDNDDYECKVIKISRNYDLEAYQYFLKDRTGLTSQFGEIALQNISGSWHGIDVTWDDDGPADTNQGNSKADRAKDSGGAYIDTDQAQIRIDDVQAGTQGTKNNQKSEGRISASFMDNDRNGKLTAGDQFTIRGNQPYHPANDGWRLEIKYDISDDTIGSFLLGA